MFTEYQLKHFAENFARNYLEKNISLNESITKLAENKNLNRHYISRLAELSNRFVYLSLMEKSAIDRYVKFEIASPDKITKDLKKEPVDDTLYFDDYAIKKEVPVEKKAEFSPEFKHYEKLLISTQKLAHDVRIRYSKNENEFFKEFNKFAFHIKQGILLDTLDFSTLNAVFGQELMEKTATYIDLKSRYNGEIKTPDGIVNPNHPAVESYNKLVTLQDEALNIIKEAEKIEDLLKEAAEVGKASGIRLIGEMTKRTGQTLGDLLKKTWRHKKLVGATIGLPALYALGVRSGRKAERQKFLYGQPK